MPGTKLGAIHAKETMIEKLGSDKARREWYKEQGALGGKASNNGGFASDVVGADGLSGRERASVVGVKGGRISRRKPKTVDLRAEYTKKMEKALAAKDREEANYAELQAVSSRVVGAKRPTHYKVTPTDVNNIKYDPLEGLSATHIVKPSREALLALKKRTKKHWWRFGR